MNDIEVNNIKKAAVREFIELCEEYGLSKAMNDESDNLDAYDMKFIYKDMFGEDYD